MDDFQVPLLIFPGILGFLGDIVSGIFGLGGSAMQAGATAEANRMNMEIAKRQMAMQREFAQHGIRWKIEDAKAAGLSPLAAIGAPGVSASPISVGVEPDLSTGAGVSRFGQDITRSMRATQTPAERAAGEEQMKSMRLDNELKSVELMSRLARLDQESNPSFPGGVGTSTPGTKGVTGGILQGGTWYWAPDGRSVHLAPSDKVKQLVEDNLIQESVVNNAIMQAYVGGLTPDGVALPKGTNSWKFDPVRMGMVPYNRPSSLFNSSLKGRKIIERERKKFPWD